MGNIFGQEFERDEATKLGVLSLVDDTHATAAQPLDDAVVRDGCPIIGDRLPAVFLGRKQPV